MKTDAQNPQSDPELDAIFARLFARCREAHPCAECQEGTAFDEDTLCADCYAKTPAGREAALHREEKERAEREAALTKRLQRAIPPELVATRLDHPEFNMPAWKKADGLWQPDMGDWCWLYSQGSGYSKSRIAYLLVRKWMHWKYPQPPRELRLGESRESPVVWLDADTFLNACRIRKQYSLGHKTMSAAHELIERAKHAKMLVLDDFTKHGTSSEVVSEGVWEVIKHRFDWQLATLFTDNKEIESLEAIFHPNHAPYIDRRMRERCVEICCGEEAGR